MSGQLLVSGAGVAWTKEQFSGKAAAWAARLVSSGAHLGDRILLIGRNSPSMLAVITGCWGAGLIPVPVNWRLASAELAVIVSDSRPAVIVADDEFVPKVPGISDAIILSLSDEPSGDRIHSQRTDAALLLYTAGTTGHPKGVVLSHHSLAVSSTIGRSIEMGPEAVVLASLPFFHIGGLGYALFGLSVGAHVVVVPDADTATIVAAFGEWGVTHVGLVPTLLHRLVEQAEAGQSITRLQMISYGGAAITSNLVGRTHQALGARLCQMYGLTETGGVVSLLGSVDHDHPDHLHSVGRPLSDVELRIADPVTGTPLPVGEVGEVVVRSGHAMLGYWGRPPGEEWFRTGDLGHVDDAGYLYLAGRLDDMIISGGENIYPEEVEDVLVSHPAVSEAAVVGVPSAEWGAEVKGVVVATGELDVGDLFRHCRQHLGGFKAPRHIEVVDELPKSAAGKVLRRELRNAP
jgi:acyl-CoA synthetase (AMP-forming)/AMP-acid ligase II